MSDKGSGFRPTSPRRGRSMDDLEGQEQATWEPLGRAIKVERTARGLERKELAERAGLSYPYLAEIESGRKRPSTKALMLIARALGVSMSELVRGGETMPEPPARATWFHDRGPSGPTYLRMRAAARGPREVLMEQVRDRLGMLSDEDLEYVTELVERLARGRAR